MPVILKGQQAAVVDALRASRNADDEISRLKENSLEAQRTNLLSLVEAGDWKFGPAELVATFPHHLLCKSPQGELVQVEWSSREDGYSLGRAVVHEINTPVADLGAELMETARSAVDMLIEGDSESAQPMITTLAETLDSGGSLQRRVTNEIAIRSLNRNAWWHHVVEGATSPDRIPNPQTEGADALDRSINDLLFFLKEEASVVTKALRSLSNMNIAKDVDALACDVAEDVERAVSVLASVSNKNQEEALQIYEAVASATPRLLNGIEFLRKLTTNNDTTAAG